MKVRKSIHQITCDLNQAIRDLYGDTVHLSLLGPALQRVYAHFCKANAMCLDEYVSSIEKSASENVDLWVGKEISLSGK